MMMTRVCVYKWWEMNRGEGLKSIYTQIFTQRWNEGVVYR